MNRQGEQPFAPTGIIYVFKSQIEIVLNAIGNAAKVKIVYFTARNDATT
jgi:hypothetical protein